MADMLQFVVLHGYTLLFFWVLAEQAGLPFRRRPCCWLRERWRDNIS